MARKLAICIPTYNRRNFLEELIASIRPQLSDEVEIVISDNASSDDTESYCTDLVKQDHRIRYFRAQENAGPDANMLRVVELANAEYCWWMGDDDKIVPDGIQRMLALVSANPSIVVCNSKVMNKDFSKVLGVSLGDGDVSTPDEALLTFGSWITFVSGLCFSRDQFIKLISFTRSKIGSQLMQSYPMLDLIKHGPVGYDPAPLVEFRAENSGGYNLYQIFVKQFDLLCDHAAEIGFSPATVRKLRKDVVRRVVVPVTIERKITKVPLDISEGLSYIIRGKMDGITKATVLLVVVTPAVVYQLLKPCYRTLKKFIGI